MSFKLEHSLLTRTESGAEQLSFCCRTPVPLKLARGNTFSHKVHRTKTTVTLTVIRIVSKVTVGQE